MASMKVAVSLEGLPQMLQAIVLEALRLEPDLEVLEGASNAAGADVLITGPLPTPEAMLRQARVRRLIEVDAEGRFATVYSLRYDQWRVDDPSPSRLVALLRELAAAPQQAPPRSLFARLLRPGRPTLPKKMTVQLPQQAGAPPMPMTVATPAPTPAPASPPAIAAPEPRHDPASLALARLAARLLAARRASGPPPPQAGDELERLARELAAAAEGAPPQGEHLPGVERAVQCFGLNADERDLLLLAALVEVDPRAARLVALLNDHMSRTRPTVGVVQDLGGDLPGVLERLVSDGPLLRLRLVSLEGEGPLSTRAVKVDPAVWPLLLGMQRAVPWPLTTLEPGRLEALSLPPSTQEACARAMATAPQRPASRVLVVVAGDAGVGRRSIAEGIAAGWRDTAIVLEAASLADASAIGALAREALWSHAAVIVEQAEGLPAGLWRALTEQLEAPLLVTCAAAALPALARESARALVEVQAPARDSAHRLRLWRAQAPGAWDPAALGELAQRFDFGAEQIGTALSLARSRADLQQDEEATPAHARAACETLRETRFAGTAERIACPYELADIVLRPETRRELDLAVAWAQHGARLFEGSGAGARLRAGGGLACLFSGPPGGGKTMAAQVMARQIDYALFRVDLSQVVDKFIGESEKKLAALFDEAERARVALFFDEADALFGKRTEVRDAHDRYANVTVDYLLQRLDAFGGLVILATNFASNMDDAFLRRVRVRASFPAPDAADRRRIWDKLLPPPAQRDADIDLATLADPFELMGGEIRNAIYTAHLLAAQEGVPLAMRHCVNGLWRELGKTGRITNVGQLGAWQQVVAGQGRVAAR